MADRVVDRAASAQRVDGRTAVAHDVQRDDAVPARRDRGADYPEADAASRSMVAEFKRRRDAALAELRGGRRRGPRSDGRVLFVHSRGRRVDGRSGAGHTLRAPVARGLRRCGRSRCGIPVRRSGSACRTRRRSSDVLEGVRRVVGGAYILGLAWVRAALGRGAVGTAAERPVRTLAALAEGNGKRETRFTHSAARSRTRTGREAPVFTASVSERTHELSARQR